MIQKPMISPELILKTNPRHPAPEVAANKLQVAATRWGILKPRQIAMFLAQLGVESQLIPQEENLNYRASRICQVWPGRFPTLAAAQACAFNPQALGNLVYSGRMGNGPGEGFLYRGRGLIQLTGKANYATYGKLAGFDLVSQPDMLLQYGVSSQVAGAFWASHGLNAYADKSDVRGATRIINGGYTDLDARERLYQRSLNSVPRYGLLDTDAPLDVDRDTENDLKTRETQFGQMLDFVAFA